jgi:hypothetical protein
MPVVRALAAELGKTAVWIHSEPDAEQITVQAEWMLVTGNVAFLEHPQIRRSVREWPADARPPLVWTDDYASILPLLFK